MNINNLLSTPTGDSLGLLGIALGYGLAGLAEWIDKRKGFYWWFLPAVVFVLFAVLSIFKLTNIPADMGKVLGYLGIAAGLFCTSLTMHHKWSESKLKFIISWFILILGETFLAFAIIITKEVSVLGFVLLLITSVFPLIKYIQGPLLENT